MGSGPDLSGLYRRIEDIRAEVRQTAREISTQVEEVRQEQLREINYLKSQLFEMEKNAEKRDALQRALTEIIRVRQELEANFGSHKLVREYTLGILDAVEKNLVTKATISKCSEELMISAPKYWLAPALIALAGWIGDNKTLANRALQVAIERDEEKTCLMFALITRRVAAGKEAQGKPKTDATFQWLERYFSKQDAFDMTRSVVTYLDAYVSGIFGTDPDRICDETINKWIKEIKDVNPDFDQQQKEYWFNIFSNYCRGLEGDKYYALSRISPQFPLISAYVTKINAAEREDGIKNKITEIVNQKYDVKELYEAIDRNLKRLLSQYDKEEEPLRDEETYLSLVKEFQGDEELAKAQMDAIKADRTDEKVDFVQRLRETVALSMNGVVAPSSEIKTAFRLLQDDINGAFEEFVSVDKSSYPEEIDLIIKENCGFSYVNDDNKPNKPNGFIWEGKTVNSENREELVNSLAKQYDQAKEAALSKIEDEKGKKLKKAGIVSMCCIVGIVLIFGIVLFAVGNGKLKKNAADRKTAGEYFDRRKEAALNILNNALDARIEANKTVEDFDKARESEGAVVSL